MQTMILTLCVAGFLLIVAEMFLPGLVAGVLGGLLMIVACALTYREYGADAGNLMAVSLFFCTLVGFVIWMKLFPRTPMGKMLMLGAKVGSPPLRHEGQSLEGVEGEAMSNLRPAGVAMLGGSRVDVVAENEFIVAGARVRVVEVDGMRVVVRRVDPGEG